MNVSGTLHLYSGEDRELFFVFDDDVAQQLYRMNDFDMEDKRTRLVFISVGGDHFIHVRTMSFSRKQTEIKVSLCSATTKDGLKSLTALYDWFAPSAQDHPEPFAVLGQLRRVERTTDVAWELAIAEPVDLVVPPGLRRRRKRASKARHSWQSRRKIEDRELAKIGRIAEALALKICQKQYPVPRYQCLWRDKFYDSEREEIRKLGIIADIDVWDAQASQPALVVEVKAQKISAPRPPLQFYLSNAEWRSYTCARSQRLKYEVWVFQYKDISDFVSTHNNIRRIVLSKILREWLDPDSFAVRAPISAGAAFSIKLP
jgi:hypothetical protein